MNLPLAERHLLTDERRLDISDTFNMVYGNGIEDMYLQDHVSDWCHDVLGSVPSLVFSRISEGDYEWVHLVFKNEADPVLFRINFAHKWSPRLAR